MRRNTVLRCGNHRSFTQSKLPQVFLARLVLLASSKFKGASVAILCCAAATFGHLRKGKLPQVFLARLVLLASSKFKGASVAILCCAAATIGHLRKVNSLRFSSRALSCLK